LRFALLHRLGQPLAHGRGPEALQMAGDFAAASSSLQSALKKSLI
jgi:hypothetical protein